MTFDGLVKLDAYDPGLRDSPNPMSDSVLRSGWSSTGGRAVLVTHALIYFDDTRYDWKKHGAKQKWNPHAYGVAKATDGDATDGEELWAGLLSKHETFVLTLNGHVPDDGLEKVTTTTPGGRAVPQVLVNFPMRPNGGDGWLRRLEFRPDRTVEVFDDSPVRKQRNESAHNRFALTLAAVG